MRVSVWGLAVVLEGLSLAPFEPNDSVSEKFLTLMMAFLFTITSLKRVGELQALSVASCLEFASGKVKAILHPGPGCVPKVPTNIACSVIFEAYNPPHFMSTDQEKQNPLCLVRALECCIHQTQWRKV